MSDGCEQYSITVCGISDVGEVRHNNEDVWAELPEQRFYILADGMGGHQAGEIASREAVQLFCQAIKKLFSGQSLPLGEAKEKLTKAISYVNSHVYKLGQSTLDLRGMGTTLCVLHVHDEGVIYAHVGDSRIYRYRNGSLKLLTKDHSLLRELLDLGQIREENASDFHYKNIITRAIGTEPQVEPTVKGDTLSHQEIYLLCSDGLSDLMATHEIEVILKHATTISQAASDLVSLSKKRGGHDNVTVLLVEVSKNDVKKHLSRQ